MEKGNLVFEKTCLLVMILIVGFILGACATANFNQRSYQILKTSQATYDLATDSIIELNKMGLIPAEDYAKIEAKADIYAEAHNAAVDAIKAFKLDTMTAEQTGDKIAAVSVALTELLKLAQPYILQLDKGGK